MRSTDPCTQVAPVAGGGWRLARSSMSSGQSRPTSAASRDSPNEDGDRCAPQIQNSASLQKAGSMDTEEMADREERWDPVIIILSPFIVGADWVEELCPAAIMCPSSPYRTQRHLFSRRLHSAGVRDAIRRRFALELVQCVTRGFSG